MPIETARPPSFHEAILDQLAGMLGVIEPPDNRNNPEAFGLSVILAVSTLQSKADDLTELIEGVASLLGVELAQVTNTIANRMMLLKNLREAVHGADDFSDLEQRVKALAALPDDLEQDITEQSIASLAALIHLAEGVISYADDEQELLARAMGDSRGWAFCSRSVLLGKVLRRIETRHRSKSPQQSRLGIEAQEIVITRGDNGDGYWSIDRNVVANPRSGDMWRLDNGGRRVVLVVDDKVVVFGAAGDPQLVAHTMPFVVDRADMLISLFGATFETSLSMPVRCAGAFVELTATPVNTLVRLCAPSPMHKQRNPQRNPDGPQWAVRLPDGRAVIRPHTGETPPWSELASQHCTAQIEVPAIDFTDDLRGEFVDLAPDQVEIRRFVDRAQAQHFTAVNDRQHPKDY